MSECGFCGNELKLAYRTLTDDTVFWCDTCKKAVVVFDMRV